MAGMTSRRLRQALPLIAVIFGFLPASLCSWTSTSQLQLQSTASGSLRVPGRLNLLPSLRSSLRLKGGAPPAAGRKVLDDYSHEIKSSKNDGRQGNIHVEVAKLPDKTIECIMTSSIPGAVSLHWGFASRGGGWTAPPDKYLPEGTKKVGIPSPFRMCIFDAVPCAF